MARIEIFGAVRRAPDGPRGAEVEQEGRARTLGSETQSVGPVSTQSCPCQAPWYVRRASESCLRQKATERHVSTIRAARHCARLRAATMWARQQFRGSPATHPPRFTITHVVSGQCPICGNAASILQIIDEKHYDNGDNANYAGGKTELFRSLTLPGWNKYEELDRKVRSKTAFIAMKFGTDDAKNYYFQDELL